MIEDLEFLHYTHLEKLNAKSLICVDTDSFKNDLPKAEKITWLSLAKNFSNGSNAIIETCTQMASLKYLDLRGKGLEPKEIYSVLQNCKNLRTLLFDSYYFTCDMNAWENIVHKQFGMVCFTDKMYSHLLAYRNFRALVEL